MSAVPGPYVMLSENHGSVRPPPYRRNVPRYEHRKSGRSWCYRFICCFYCFLFLLIILLAGFAFFFYIVYKPQAPTYKVEGLEIKAFQAQLADFSINTEFVVSVKADNPNNAIGVIYGHDSSVVVLYKETTFCSGKLPAFYQGHKNTTVMKLDLKGKSEFGSGLQEALTQNQNSGRVPILVKVKAPVTVVLFQIPLRKIVVYVNCSLVLDSLSPNKKPGIVSTKYDIRVSL
ncbi:hypothetical protein RJ640_015715 [Escallonia rubra]|uniref:Late embryogenesis abundant protein LEA-2 subgroup domain-containing protein n=1 Tax=Escallonia rubra TaxID=112253 RepID=A0AA88RIQ9_9ASTE|nr:hypothetical protein RJ640_013913 [Escallonia rubra]KAK2993236.1 hypothetical protein RJ640_015715 [Escallonia rubra]